MAIMAGNDKSMASINSNQRGVMWKQWKQSKKA